MNEGAGFNVGCDDEREVDNRILKGAFPGLVVSVIFLRVVVLLPVLLLLKDLVPGGEGILSEVGEVDRHVVFGRDELRLLRWGVGLEWGSAKWLSNIFPFVRRSLMAAMNSLGLSSLVRVIAASTKVRGLTYVCAGWVILKFLVV